MFGLIPAKNISEKREDAILDDMKDPKKRRALLSHLETKIQHIKHILNRGVNQEDFFQIRCLLDGYVTLRKIISNME